MRKKFGIAIVLLALVAGVVIERMTQVSFKVKP